MRPRFGLTWSFDSFLGELLLVNLGLGLFNLIPAFPMDGGRVLRAVLSTVLGRAQATHVASIVGQVLAVLFAFAALPGRVIRSIWRLPHSSFSRRGARMPTSVMKSGAAQTVKANATGMWVAPPGYHWVDRGNGLWQLAPIGVRYPDPAAQDASAWR